MSKAIDPEFLLDLAQKRERRLTARERRVVLTHLVEHGYKKVHRAHRSNYQLADLFGVSEAMIRQDKKRILREAGNALQPDQAMAIVTSSAKALDRLIRAAEEGLDETDPGTLAHRDYLRVIADLEQRRLKLAQDIGLVEHNLGQLQVTEEHWVARTSESGITTVTPADEGGGAEN